MCDVGELPPLDRFVARQNRPPPMGLRRIAWWCVFALALGVQALTDFLRAALASEPVGPAHPHRSVVLHPARQLAGQGQGRNTPNRRDATQGEESPPPAFSWATPPE
jgi:hypothetical protein